MSQLRISSGSAKNKKLAVPNIPDFRPVQEVIKQAIFAIIGAQISKAKCLDLFAGSGNMGFEALSRGASSCDFVDAHPESIITVEKNATDLGFTQMIKTYLKNASKYVLTTKEKYDIIFMDPFYEDTSQIHLLKNLSKLMKPKTIVAYTYGKALDISTLLKDTQLEVATERSFGATKFAILLQKGEKFA